MREPAGGQAGGQTLAGLSVGGGTLERRKEGRRPSGKEGAGPGTAFTLALWGAGRSPHPTQAPSSLRIIML